jgi:hypothetical protein
MIAKPEDKLLKSFTGLEGGVVASGSTCGVVSGGAMGLALSHGDEIMEKGIREHTGIGDDLLEQLSFIFDGGIGLQGGACGALVGAIMGVNLLIGMNVREMKSSDILKGFVVGHKNLLTNKPVDKPEPFSVGKEIVKNFKEEAGAVECRTITRQKFSDWFDFQDFISSSGKCPGLIEFATDQASIAVDKYTGNR